MITTSEQEVALHSTVETELRKAISVWANSLPHHPHQDLGKTITVTKIMYTPLYLMNLKTQFYSLGDVSKVRPYRNGKQYPGGAVKLSPTPHTSFSRHHVAYTLPGTEEEIRCGSCNGSGKINCGVCGGQGRTRCRTCNGSGVCTGCGGSGTRTCSGCGGSGSHVTGNHRQSCNTCGGTGRTFCTYCMRSGRCTSCNNGYVSCRNCGGSGRITCGTCEGSGRLISFTERSENWDFSNLNEYALSPGLASGFQKIKVHHDPSMKIIDEKRGAFLAAASYDNEPSHFCGAFKNILNRGVDPAGLTLHHNPRILEQRILVGEISAYHIHYTYDREPFNLLMFINDNQVYEEDGPVIRFKKELISAARKSYKARNFGRSAENIQKAHEMGLDGNDAQAIKLKGKIEQKIISSYRVGAVLGTLILTYFLSLWIVSYFGHPWFVLPVATDFANSMGTGFIALNNILLCVTGVIINLVASTRIAKTMFPMPGYKIQPELIRMLSGFLSIVPYTLLSMFTLVLLNATGILLPVTRIIYFLLRYIDIHANSGIF